MLPKTLLYSCTSDTPYMLVFLSQVVPRDMCICASIAFGFKHEGKKLNTKDYDWDQDGESMLEKISHRRKE